MKNITILGSTGSIGRTTLQVVNSSPKDFRVVGLTCGRNWKLLAEEVKSLKNPPSVIAIKDETHLKDLKNELRDFKIEILVGEEGICDIASLPNSNLVMVAIVGSSALRPLLSAIKARKTIALANKESLVMAGGFVKSKVDKNRVKLIPVDSEHSAVEQCIGRSDTGEVERIILTASGGPFWRYTKEMLETVTISEALNHPNWDMGDKITLDSATMMNKGFEVIEAHYLFGLPYSSIDVLIHPQSVVHALVEITDGSMLAQMAYPDMILPIQHSLTYPERRESTIKPLGIEMMSKLEFFPPDYDRFPSLKMAYEAGLSGGSAPIILNASNDMAVGGFLEGKIGFLDIFSVIEETLGILPQQNVETLDEVFAIDREARDIARGIVSDYSESISR